MFAGVGESVVIGVANFAIGGDAVAPGQRVSFRGGGDGGFAMALVALDLGEDVQGVGMEKRIRAAFGGIPDLVEEVAGDGGFVFAPVEFGQRSEGGKFVFDETDRADAGESVLEAFGGRIQVVQAEGGGTLKARGADEVGFVARNSRQFPGALSEKKSTLGIAEQEEAFGEVGVHNAFELLMFLRNPDFQGTFEGDFRFGAKTTVRQIKPAKILSLSFRVTVLMLPAQLNCSLASGTGLAQSSGKAMCVGKTDQVDGSIRGVVFAPVGFDGTAVKRNGAAGLTTKVISMSQLVESETLI